MIQTINNVKKFLESSSAPIYIYGAGNPGRWVSYYMNRCKIDFAGYIDLAVPSTDCYIGDKRIFHPEQLKKIKEPIRIIIAICKPEEALATLHWYADVCNMLCLVPLYKDMIHGVKTYDINSMLSYFRSKLISPEHPTIISNTCSAGLIYHSLGINALSPTINIVINSYDYLKLCKDLPYYMDQEIKFYHWTIYEGKRRPIGMIRDINVLFAHSDNMEESIRNWNYLRRAVNWDNLIYIMADNRCDIPYQIAKEFCMLPQKHMLILKNNLYSGNMKGLLHVNHGHFHMRDSAIENWFDLVGWINGEFEI